MKAVAFNGSPRKNGNTSILIKHVLNELEKANVEGEVVNLAGGPIRGCTACGRCRENRNRRCAIDDDIVNFCIEKMIEADVIIIGSPTYFSTMNAETKALIDRAGYVSRGNGGLFKRKIGSAVVAVRRAGAINAFQQINNFFLINEMIVPGSSYWNIGVGGQDGDVKTDQEGLQTLEVLAENILWLLKKIK